MKFRALLNILISYVLLFPAGVVPPGSGSIAAAAAPLEWDSRPVTVSNPTGVAASEISRPVSVGIPPDISSTVVSVGVGPALVAGDEISKPVSVSMPTGAAGEEISRPVSVGIPSDISSTVVSVGVGPARAAGDEISKPVSVAVPTRVASDEISYPVSAAFQPQNLGDPDLVGLWHMDGDWGDSSGKENHGTPFNGPVFSADKKIGTRSGSFDGSDDYISVLTAGFPTGSTARTITAWVKTTTTTGDKSVFHYGAADGSTPPKNFHLFLSSGKAGIGNGYGHGVAVGTSSVANGAWHFIAGVYEGAGSNLARIYVDGVQENSGAITTPNTSSASAMIGRFLAGGGQFNGLMDEVAVYKRALTAEEIAFLYHSGISEPGAPAPPALNPVQSPVGSSSVTLSGKKDLNTSIWVNNKKIVSLDNQSAWQGVYDGLVPGINILNAYAVDADFRKSEPATASLIYDNQPPVLESSAPANNSDTAKPVTSISLTFTDTYSGINTTASIEGATVMNSAGQAVSGTWKASGARTIVFTPAAWLTADTFTVTAYPVDSVGNRGTQQIVFKTYDITPPETKAELSGTKGTDGWYSTVVTVTLTADDGANGSGVALTEYSLDGATWLTYSTPFVLDTDGVATLRYRSRDNAVNFEATKTVDVKINKTGLVGLWHMDNDNWIDSSVVGNNGTAYGNASFDGTTPKLGSHAGRFDGAGDYISMTDSPTLHSDRAISVLGWFFVNSFDKEWQTIYWKGNTPDCTTNCENREYALWLHSTGYLHFSSTPLDRVGIGQLYANTPAGVVQTGAAAGWHHFATVIDSDHSSMKVYVNGIEKASGTYSYSGIRDTSSPLMIGNNPSWNSSFNGLMDEVAIYNRALSDQEVQEHYLNYSIPTPTVEPVPSPTNAPAITLRGTKTADIASAIMVNGVEVWPLDTSETWQGTYTLTSGMNNLNVTAMDAEGFHSAEVVVSVALDDTAPAVTSTDPVNNGWYNMPISSVTFNLSDTFSAVNLEATASGAMVRRSGAGVAGMWSLSGTGRSGTIIFTPLYALDEGAYTAVIYPTDSFGNAATASIAFTVDATAPPPPSFGQVASPTRNTSIIINGGKSADTVQVVLSGAGVSFGPISYPSASAWSVTVYGLSQGTNTISAYALDAAGNPSASNSINIVVDTSPPATPTVLQPASPTKDTVITLSGTKGSDSYAYVNSQKTADSYASTTWSHPVALNEGNNSFTIFAKDEAGNQSGSVTVSVIRDTTPPSLVSSSPAAGALLNALNNISLTLSDTYAGVDFQGSLTGAEVRNSSGASVAGSWSVSDAQLVFTPAAAFGHDVYTVSLSPVDMLGNKGTASFSFTLDITLPTVQSVTMNPASPHKAEAVAFTIAFSEDMLSSAPPEVVFTGGSSNAAYALSGSWTSAKTWQGTYTFTAASGDGDYTIRISNAKDMAQNTMAPDEAATFLLDTIAPAAPIVNAFVSPTKNASVTLTGEKETDSYLYVNNNKNAALYTDITWTHTASLTEGNNSFTIYAKDEAGNQSGSVTVSVVRDTTPPSLSSSTPAANSLVAVADTISVILSDAYAGVDLQGSLTGAGVKNSSGASVAGSWAVSGTQLVFTPLPSLVQDVYTVSLSPVDMLGNKGMVSFSFTLDTTLPMIQSVTMNPTSPHKAEAVTFTITFNEDMLTTVQPAVTFTTGWLSPTYTLTGNWTNAKTWQGTYTFTANTGDGTYMLKVAGAQDKAGNVMTTYEAKDLFVLDTAPPAAPTINAVTTPTNVPNQTLTGTKEANTAVIINNVQRVSLDANAAWSYTYPLSEGQNTLTIISRDAAGNDSPKVTPEPVIVLDTTPPVFTVDTYQNPSQSATQTLAGTKEPGCVVKLNNVQIFGAEDTSPAWSYLVTLTEGITNRLTFTAADALGNSKTLAIDILYDISAPPALGPGVLVADGSGKGTDVTLTWSAYIEAADVAYYRVYMSPTDFSDAGGLTPVGTVNKGTKTYKVTGLVQGKTYYFAVVPVDVSGNFTSTVHTASAAPTDTLAPEDVTVKTVTAGYTASQGNFITIAWTPSADSSGDLADQIVYFDSGAGYDTGTPIGKTATTYTKTSLNDATKYKFRITVKDASGHESAGVVAEGVTRLDNPTGLTAQPGNSKVALAWTAVSSSYIKQYNIYRATGTAQKTDVSQMTLIYAASKDTKTYTDTGITNGMTYQYAVTVLNTYGAERTDVQSVAATPRSDATGPVIDSYNIISGQVITAPVTITASAHDEESTMDRMELSIDGTLVKSQSSGNLSYSWNVVNATDGNHAIKLAAYDSKGNVTEDSRQVVVSLAPPAVPSINAHTVIQTTPEYLVSVTGTAALYTTITLKVNGVVVATATSTSTSTFAFSSVKLVEGDNLLAVKASHRGGESAYSPNYKIIVDTGAPPVPQNLVAQTLPGGLIRFTWANGMGEAPIGYNLYKSDSQFSFRTDTGVTKANTSAIIYLFNEYNPGGDALTYYAVTALDGAGNESGISNVVAVSSDNVAPSVTSIVYTYTPSPLAGEGGGEGVTVAGPGNVNVTVTISEPLKELPFFSLEPQEGSPIVISMQKAAPSPLAGEGGGEGYEGTFTVTAQSPHGPTTYKFSGKDMVGNRGNAQGAGITIDVRGPAATIEAPITVLQITAQPVEVKVAFDEPSVIQPVMTLKASDGGTAQITGLASADSGIHWTGSVDVSSLAEGQAEFILSESKDQFGNTSTLVSSGKNILLYRDSVPPPGVPTGLTATSQKAGAVKLEWLSVVSSQQSVVTYNLYRRAEGETTATKIQTGIGSSTNNLQLTTQNSVVTQDTPDQDGTHYYSVTSVGLLGSESPPSAEVQAISDRTGPAAPTGLSLTLGGNGVSATWTAPTSNEPSAMSYKLYRSSSTITDTTAMTAVATSTTTSAIDPSPAQSLRFYAVTAVDGLGNEGPVSESVEITFPVAPVRNLVLERLETSAPRITWDPPAEGGITGYYIYRNGSRIIDYPVTDRTYTDGYYSGGTATYGISAVNDLGNESPVKEVTLSDLSIGLKDGTTLRRGQLETAHIIVSISAPSTLVGEGGGEGVTIDTITVKVGDAPASTLSGPFTLTGNSSLQLEKVVATLANAPATVAVPITATWSPSLGVTVKITQTSAASVTSSGSALEIFSEPLVRGTEAKVKLKVNNLGSSQMEFLTSENNGKTTKVKVNLKDQDGNLLATGYLDQRIGSSIVNAAGYAVARINPGETFTTDPITFTVPQTAPYKVIIEAVIENTYYHYGKSDQVTAPGMSQSMEATISETAYHAVAAPEKTFYPYAQPVVITGQAISNTEIATGNSQPVTVPYMPVKLGISVKGFDRFFTVTTDGSGNFSYTFTPGSNEAGTYSVWAMHPDVSARSVQSTFTIAGLQIDPQIANWKMLKNGTADIPVKLTNTGDTQLTNLQFTTDTSSGIIANVINSGDTALAAGETQNFTLHISAGSTASDTGYATLLVSAYNSQLANSQPATARLDVNLTFVTAIPIISTSPSYIDTGMVRGDQKIATFTITNTGAGTLTNARLEGPSTSWMSLTVNNAIGDIAPGASKTVGILLNPQNSLTQGVYDDRIVIYSDNHIPYTYHIQVTVTSNAVGNVVFDVLNIFSEDVPNATITFQHQTLLDLIYTVKTGTDGTVMQYDIPEGRYTYTVSPPPGHLPTSGTFEIMSGLTTNVYIALEVKLVDITWSVVPTVIEDKYEIQVSQTFETNVPIPVLVTEPPSITLPEMKPGEVFNGEYTVKNYGLIAAEHVNINFPTSFLDYDIEVLLSAIPDRIEAQKSITVPYKITRRQNVASAFSATQLFDEICGYGAGCVTSFNINTSGDYVQCPNTPQQSTGTASASHVVGVPQSCPTGSSGSYIYSGGGGGSGGGYGGGGGQGGGGGTPQPQPTTITPPGEPCKCKPDGTPCPDDGKICTFDKCIGESCQHPPNDSAIPPQNASDDCKKEICQGGTPVTVDDLNETAPVDPLAEEKFCALHPIDCVNAYPLSDQSLQWAESMVNSDPNDDWTNNSLHNGIADAARHAYWMCKTAEQFGSGFAEGLGNAHEEDSGYTPGSGGGGSGNSCCEKLMDLHNNQVGRSLASQPGTCEEKVLNSLGQLQYDICN